MRRATTTPLLALAALACLAGCGSKRTARPTPADAAVFNNNGVMLLEHDRGDARGAIALFRRAVEARPSYALAQTNLGIALYALAAGSQEGSYRDAIAALDKAEKMGGRFPSLYFARAVARLNTRDYTNAVRDLRAVLAIDPKDAFTLYHMGMAFHHQRNHAEAARWFRLAVERLPSFQSAYYNLGMALMLLGQKDAGQAALTKFQELKASGRGVMAGGEYFATQGRYMEPLEDPSAPRRAAVGPMVVFADATSASGIRLPDIGGAAAPIAAAWGDVDNDTRPDLALARGGRVSILHNDGGRFSPLGPDMAYPGIAAGATWGDYDNDGVEDLLVYGSAGLRLYRSTGRTLQDVSASALSNLPAARAPIRHAAWVDYDHDGFLDIVAAPENGPCILLRNNTTGKGASGVAFTDVSQRTGVSAARGDYVLATDFDRNRAIDLLVIAADGKHTLLRNNYNGTFSPAKGAAGLSDLGPAHRIAAADLDSDGLIDYVAATDHGVMAALHQRDDTFKVRPLVPGETPQAAQSVTIADFDDDGNYDVLATAGHRLRLYRGNGDGTFVDTTAAAGLANAAVSGSEHPVIADADLSGFADILLPGARPILLKNAGNANRWVRLNLRGLKVAPSPQYDAQRTGARANGDGIGCMVEAWTDSTWLTTEVTSSAGDDTQPIMGLGASANPRWLRVLWTTGVHECEPLGEQVQGRASSLAFRDYDARDPSTGAMSRATGVYVNDNGQEMGIAAFKRGAIVTALPVKLNSTVALWEPDRNPTSCPVLYVWDGERYRFITDLQGGAIIGYNVGEYQYYRNDPDEYVMLPPGAAVPRGGFYEVEISDQLQEVLFIDAVHMLAVDHPAGTRVLSNDRMLAGPPYPKFGVWSVDRVQPLRAATDDRGADVLPLLARIDRRYPEGFERLRYQGFTRDHALTLDVGDTRGARQVLLLLYGWQDYSHSSSNLAAAHAGIYGRNPSVQVLDRQGRWRTVIPDMGSIAGLPKWLAVDLTGKFLSDDRRVRIVTNLALFWDKAEVGLRFAEDPVRVTRMAPAQADYHWLGYPEPTYPDGRDPVVYDYARRRAVAPWMTPAGWYTRPGDVTELLQKPDDRYVIMRHGHAMHIAFDARRLPPLPRGWTRDFAVYSGGFGKDMDMNGGAAMTVDPLPFHAMRRYPYGSDEHYPTDSAYVRYQATYNTVYIYGTAAITRWPELLKGAQQ